MPNNFHLIAGSIADGDLSNYMRWLMTAHVRRSRAGGDIATSSAIVGGIMAMRASVPAAWVELGFKIA